MKWEEAMKLCRELRAKGCDPYKILIGDLFAVRCQSGNCGGCRLDT